MRSLHCAFVAAVSLLLGGAALAQHATHGDRAYSDALRFAQENQLPHFTTRVGGVQRLVVNVPNAKIPAWCNLFSKQNCYMEPFFDASRNYPPSWSRLRIGNECFSQYGSGLPYNTSTGSCRFAFPVAMTQQEFATTEHKIRTSPNGPWNYNGGDPERTGRNCTNWVTYKIGQFTGVTTPSVKHHCSSLVQGYCSPRMTVMAIMTPQAIPNFGQDQLRLDWPRGH